MTSKMEPDIIAIENPTKRREYTAWTRKSVRDMENSAKKRLFAGMEGR